MKRFPSTAKINVKTKCIHEDVFPSTSERRKGFQYLICRKSKKKNLLVSATSLGRNKSHKPHIDDTLMYNVFMRLFAVFTFLM